MRSIMYDQSSVQIVLLLFVSLVLGIEIGYRIGLTVHTKASQEAKSHISAIQASLLGVLALLLGFTFSQSLQRFDARSEAVVDEANAIGTAYLRAQLLPASVREESKNLLLDYLALRVEAAAISLDTPEERNLLLANATQKQNALWRLAEKAAADDGSPVRSGYFIQALNELIDSYGRRDAAITRHVPELVILLLFATFILTGVVVGYASGAEAHRPSIASYVLVLLIVLLVFVIIDLDRPRRGLIEVPQNSLKDLRTNLTSSDAAAN